MHIFDFLPTLAEAAVKSTALLALAAVLAFSQRRYSAAVRHLTWIIALIGVLLIPAFSWLLPAWPVQGLYNWRPNLPTPPAAASSFGLERQNMSGQERQSGLTMPATSLAGVAVPKIQDEESRHAQILSTLGILWLTGSAIGLFCMFAGWCQVAVLTRRCTPLEDTEWCLLLNDAARRTRLRRPVRLLVGKGVALPMTWGAWRPVILLPEQARAWPDKRRSLVLLHELAHVQRCDWLMQILACFSCAICWYNPLVWYAMQRMRLEREQACDDIVLKHDALPSEYAHELLQYALGFQEGRLLDWATVPMARRGSLECRLLAILDPHRNRAGLMGRNCWRICPGD